MTDYNRQLAAAKLELAAADLNLAAKALNANAKATVTRDYISSATKTLSEALDVLNRK